MKDNTTQPDFKTSLLEFLKENERNQCVRYNMFQSDFELEVDGRYDDQEQKDFKAELSEIVSSVENVDNYGGEDMGSAYWSVYEFTSKDKSEKVLIQFDGWYQSFNGSEFEEFFEVKPQPVQKIEYVKV